MLINIFRNRVLKAFLTAKLVLEAVRTPKRSITSVALVSHYFYTELQTIIFLFGGIL